MSFLYACLMGACFVGIRPLIIFLQENKRKVPKYSQKFLARGDHCLNLAAVGISRGDELLSRATHA
jgi:hypothetical protein